MNLTDLEMDTMALLMRRARLGWVRRHPESTKRTRHQVTLTLAEITPEWQGLVDKGLVEIDYDPTFCPGRLLPYFARMTATGTKAFNARWDEERKRALAQRAEKIGTTGGE